ncbi:hypothetical protein AB4Y89_18050 [Terriglobus sp. 2YAB30_2]|uniref:hypothetical protein n=1 Tax=unclassified Terriglobus TaxID=2628988 RepID=UPI003F9B80D6
MFVRFPVLAVIACVFLAGSEGNTQQLDNLSSRQAKLLTQTAHTSADFEKLADYFHARSLHFHKHAADEDAIMRQEATHASGVKYPSSYETAHRLRDYYQRRSEDAGTKAVAYERKSQSSSVGSASR